MGIEAEDQAQIFQPFFRAAKQGGGTGLGLSIAREIVMLHGGDIGVESKVGKGSIFYVHLPLLTTVHER
jgi:two-component system sensor histidine kinase SaeS